MSDIYYKKKIPSCTLPDGTEWFAGAAGDSSTLRACTQVPIVAKNPTVTNSEYIERKAVLAGVEKRLKNPAIIGWLTSIIADIPAADVVPVVRCRDCKHTREKTSHEAVYLIPECLICEHPEVSEDGWAAVKPEHFCSYGDRKDGEIGG